MRLEPALRSGRRLYSVDKFTGSNESLSRVTGDGNVRRSAETKPHEFFAYILEATTTTMAARALSAISFTLLVAILFIVSAQETSCNAGDQDEGDSSGNCSWIDEMSGKFRTFLEDKVFGQESMQNVNRNGFLSLLDTAILPDERQRDDPILGKLFNRISDFGKDVSSQQQADSSSEADALVGTLLQRLEELAGDDNSIVGAELWKVLQDALGKALVQLKNSFGDVVENLDSSIFFSVMYYVMQEDAIKNPSWKRRQHRFYPSVTKEFVLEVHDALYLSKLAYVNSVDDFRAGLEKFRNNEWELAYGTTESLPHLPSHFLLIHKTLGPLKNPTTRTFFPWEIGQDSEMTVAIVVRGTKHVSDAIADALLEPVEYRGGYAHGGILENGKSLAALYVPKLKALLELSQRDKLRIYLVGHSLGAGAAAIAAMEFEEFDWMKVEAVGFGCPSLLSPELSESTKDYITTIVSDADIIPRMSGASVANFLLDLLEFDWTDLVLEDVESALDRFQRVFPLTQMLPGESMPKKVRDLIEENIKPMFKQQDHPRFPSVLIPPGNCVHFYRDGVGYSGVFTPCAFFSSIDLTRTMIDDHLIMPGYHRSLLTLMRDWQNDFNWDFTHDLASIPT